MYLFYFEKIFYFHGNSINSKNNVEYNSNNFIQSVSQHKASQPSSMRFTTACILPVKKVKVNDSLNGKIENNR